MLVFNRCRECVFFSPACTTIYTVVNVAMCSLWSGGARLQDNKVTSSQRKVQHQSIRSLSSGKFIWNAASDHWVWSILAAVRRLSSVATAGLGWLHGSSVILGYQLDWPELPHVTRLVAQAQSPEKVRVYPLLHTSALSGVHTAYDVVRPRTSWNTEIETCLISAHFCTTSYVVVRPCTHTQPRTQSVGVKCVVPPAPEHSQTALLTSESVR